MKNMAFAHLIIIFLATSHLIVDADEGLEDFEFTNDEHEIMIAQESRQYQTVVKPPVRIIKPNGVTNSHRPQYNLDSFEDTTANDDLSSSADTPSKKTSPKDYKPSQKIRTKEGMIRDAVLRAFERRDHVGRFAQVLPIIRSMSGTQRVALATLVANQVSAPPGKSPLSLSQVRSMFGDNVNTSSDLMLPILLDIANLIHRTVIPSKEYREVKHHSHLPHAQLLRRSFTEDEDILLDDEPFDIGLNNTKQEQTTTTKAPKTTQSTVIRNRNRRVVTQRPSHLKIINTTSAMPINDDIHSSEHDRETIHRDRETINNATTIAKEDNFQNSSIIAASTTAAPSNSISANTSVNNSTLDLTAESSNQTITQDLPVAEKLRSPNRFVDRKGNHIIRRGTYPPKPSIATATRRTVSDTTLGPISKRRPPPARKLQMPQSIADQGKCELFTNTLCLHDEDYPTEAIVQSIRRNKAAAGALLADFKNPGEGAVDGVSADQESKYTAEHYLVANRRGDTANRDFASAGEAGFMCPSTVKYARPQRARATSGMWKYIVNTGEHTQTLRLEKCLKPKESCTYLTDNFKSKCVQVYNYHRLLTWDQQNGLHMDIFKVPTCCSCHIEGYSVSFPPLGHRMHETSAEQFPGEDLSSEHGNNALEAVQSSIQRPTVTKTSFTHNKPLEAFPPFSDNHNLITGSSFANINFGDNIDFSNGNVPLTGPTDSYGNPFLSDSFNQATSIRNVKRPPSPRIPLGSSNFDSATLPSFLEPPTPSASSTFGFVKETQSKFSKIGTQFKRGIRPNRRPLRKKISGGPDDLFTAGTSAISNVEIMEDFNSDLEAPEVSNPNYKLNPPRRETIAPKLQAASTEKISTTFSPQELGLLAYKNNTTSSKKINYNYHPIIDFFGDNEDKEMEEDPIDREDVSKVYIPPTESEWKPINHPVSRDPQKSNNMIVRKKT